MRPRQIQKMNSLLNDFIKTLDSEYDVIYDGAFYCDFGEMVISYSAQASTKEDRMFSDYIYGKYVDVPKISDFLLAVLHEIGHSETEDEMNDDVDVRNGFGSSNYENKEDFYKDFHQYYELHNEKLATDWAVWYLKENTQLCLELDEKIQQIVG